MTYPHRHNLPSTFPQMQTFSWGRLSDIICYSWYKARTVFPWQDLDSWACMNSKPKLHQKVGNRKPKETFFVKWKKCCRVDGAQREGLLESPTPVEDQLLDSEQVSFRCGNTILEQFTLGIIVWKRPKSIWGKGDAIKSNSAFPPPISQSQKGVAFTFLIRCEVNTSSSFYPSFSCLNISKTGDSRSRNGNSRHKHSTTPKSWKGVKGFEWQTSRRAGPLLDVWVGIIWVMGMAPLLTLITSHRGSSNDEAAPVWKCAIPAFPESMPPTRASATIFTSSCENARETTTNIMIMCFKVYGWGFKVH